MTTLRSAAERALEALEYGHFAVADQAPHIGVMAYLEAIETLRKALADQSEQALEMVIAPPQRKPLTDGEVGRLCGKFDARHSVAIGIAREIERAHGIGGEE